MMSLTITDELRIPIVPSPATCVPRTAVPVNKRTPRRQHLVTTTNDGLALECQKSILPALTTDRIAFEDFRCTQVFGQRSAH